MIGIYRARRSVKLPEFGVAENPIRLKHPAFLVFFLENSLIFTLRNVAGLPRFDSWIGSYLSPTSSFS